MAGRDFHLRLLSNHTMPINAIHDAEPISHASACSPPVVLT